RGNCPKAGTASSPIPCERWPTWKAGCTRRRLRPNEFLNCKDAKFKNFYPQITQISQIKNLFAARLSAAEGGSIQINLRNLRNLRINGFSLRLGVFAVRKSSGNAITYPNIPNTQPIIRLGRAC